ncbi:YbgC/FadM family acyl-CoA thioesterase [Sphingomonas nostoxanthinifaciens]|uniref:YbgC/FadM family acyl-CoA thioesterase n=1 Tax=Sphingomonas nostoxanthinifaciens TaxID=2872652 RepID=UPI001CC1EF13|nr:YbgC/FadM family acyl-CoA thioesterase [Sphingomonas nostoxanthinifaciens]UAK26308.1 YbgC/FadM family acyl-CoA thioesterase [Sphingomonas nostoxanthinifaciens]
MAEDLSDQPYAGRFADGAHRFALRIYYEDTDAAGIVYHANHLRYFERARGDMLALLGIDHVATLRAGEGGYVVGHVDLRYSAPALLGDALVVVSRLEEVRNSALVIQQAVMRDGQEVASGRVTVVFVGPDGRPRRQPEAWVKAYMAIRGAQAGE